MVRNYTQIRSSIHHLLIYGCLQICFHTSLQCGDFIDFSLPHKGHLKHWAATQTDQADIRIANVCVPTVSSPSKWLVESSAGLFSRGTTRLQCFTLKLAWGAALRWIMSFSLLGWRHQSRSGRPPSVYSFTCPSFSFVARKPKETEQTPSNFCLLAPSGV